MTDEPKLKPCPWCGLIPVDLYTKNQGDDEIYVYIKCINALCSMNPCKSGIKEESIAAWNRRDKEVKSE